MLLLAQAATRLEAHRVPEGAEQHVPDRKVGVVERMHAFLVVNAVALRPLEEKAEPSWRRDVPVIHELAEAAQGHGSRGGLGPKSDKPENDGAGEKAVYHDFRRVLVEAGDDLDALRAVMHLVEGAPEERRLMPPAVPPVIE